MDWLLVTPLHDWDMYHCITEFKGEGRGIKGTQFRDIAQEVDGSTYGLDEWEADKQFDGHVRSSRDPITQ